MDTILGFFSGLIIITFGLMVFAMWIVIIVLASVELYDLVMGNDSKIFPEDEDR